jgi:hypothetical protein
VRVYRLALLLARCPCKANSATSDLHLIARDVGFMVGELVTVAAVLLDMRHISTQTGRPLLTLFPHFLPKVAFMCALMWSVLSFTTFAEA